MSIKPDHWIRRKVSEMGMIEPFETGQVRGGVISYGTSSYGYDIRLAGEFTAWVDQHPEFERMAPAPLNLICFRFHPAGVAAGEGELEVLNRLNEELLARLNATGKVYLTHTSLGGEFSLRMAIGQTYTQEHHVRAAWDLIRKTARGLGAVGQ